MNKIMYGLMLLLCVGMASASLIYDNTALKTSEVNQADGTSSDYVWSSFTPSEDFELTSVDVNMYINYDNCKENLVLYLLDDSSNVLATSTNAFVRDDGLGCGMNCCQYLTSDTNNLFTYTFDPINLTADTRYRLFLNGRAYGMMVGTAPVVGEDIGFYANYGDLGSGYIATADTQMVVKVYGTSFAPVPVPVVESRGIGSGGGSVPIGITADVVAPVSAPESGGVGVFFSNIWAWIVGIFS